MSFVRARMHAYGEWPVRKSDPFPAEKDRPLSASAEQLQDVQVAVGEEIHAQAHQHQHAVVLAPAMKMEWERARRTAQLHADPARLRRRPLTACTCSRTGA